MLSRSRSIIKALLPVLIPISAFAFIKPLRVVSPELAARVTCYEGKICIDEANRLSEARALYDAAVARVEVKVGPFHSTPRVTFCSTPDCFSRFSSPEPAAIAAASLGVVIAPRGWQAFYIEHELIHYRQAEELGFLSAWTRPAWVIEGMAYSLSEDPRRPLTQPFESWRVHFEQWREIHSHAGLWPALRNAQ